MKITKFASKGFSLVEMLVVIAIIGVIAAIAVPQISDFTDSAKKSKDKRNAQNLASVCSSAQAAGHDFTAGGTLSTSATVDALVTGILINDAASAFNGEYFGVPNMAAAELTGAVPYLLVDTTNKILRYDGAGTGESYTAP